MGIPIAYATDTKGQCQMCQKDGQILYGLVGRFCGDVLGFACAPCVKITGRRPVNDPSHYTDFKG